MKKWLIEKFALRFVRQTARENRDALPEWGRDLVDCLDEKLKDIPDRMAKHGPIVEQSPMEIITRHVSSFGSYGPLIAKILTTYQKEFNKKKGD
jgi:hypothetical protein